MCIRLSLTWILVFAGFTFSATFSLGSDGPKESAPKTDLYGDPLPDGAVARLGSIRLRHAGLSDFVFASGGKAILSAGSDRVLRFWDLDTGQQRRVVKLQGAFGSGSCATLAPNGQTLAAVDKGKIIFWEVASGREIKTVPAPKNEVNYLYFSHDGQTLVIGRHDWEVTFFEWTTGKERQMKLPVFTPDNIQFSADSTFHGSFSPDGKWFVGGASWQQPLGIFDVDSAREVHRLDCHAFTSTVSPDSKRLAVASMKNDQGKKETVIRLFDLATSKEIAQFPQGKEVSYFSLAFSPDGNTLACGFSDDSCLLDLRSGRVAYRLPGRQIAPAFTPDGKTLVTTDGHSLHCWDAVTGKELQPRPGEFGYSPVLAVSPDGQLLASGDWMKQTVDMWNTTNSRQIASLQLKGERRYVRNLVFAPDGKTLISAQGMGFLQYWATGTGNEQGTLQLSDPAKPNQQRLYFFQLHSSTDGKHISTLERVLTGKEITRLAQWEASTGKLLRQHALPAGTRACAWLAGGASIAFPQGDGLTLMEIENGVPRWHVAGPASAGPLGASPDDRLLAALQAGHKGAPFTVGIWEVATGKQITTVRTGQVSHLALASDNRSLVTSDERFLRIWDLARGKERGRWSLPIAGTDAWGRSFVFGLLLSLDGRRAFSALADGTALVWDLTSPRHPIELLTKDADPKEIATWWADLSGDADRAYAAVWRLGELTGDAAVSILERKLKPIPEADIQKIRIHVKDLDSESFKVREEARKQLELLGGAAAPTLRHALEKNPSLEARRRLESLLSRPLTHAPETLRYLRAIQVLERVASKRARSLLTEIASGMTYAPETQEAKASLERLSYRDTKR